MSWISQGITPQQLADVMSGIASMPELQAQFLTSSDQQIEVFMRNNIELMNVGTALGMSTQAVQALTQQMINNQKRPMMERIRSRALMGVMGNVAGFNPQEVAVMQQLAGAGTLEERQRITTDNATIIAGLRTKVENLQMDDSMSRLMLEQVDGLRSLFDYVKSETILSQSKNAPGFEYINKINDSLRLTAQVSEMNNQTLAKTAAALDLATEAMKTTSGKLSLIENVAGVAFDAGVQKYQEAKIWVNNAIITPMTGDQANNKQIVEQTLKDQNLLQQYFASMTDTELKDFVNKNKYYSQTGNIYSKQLISILGEPIDVSSQNWTKIRDNINETFTNTKMEKMKEYGTDEKGNVTNLDQLTGYVDNMQIKTMREDTDKLMREANITQSDLNKSVMALSETMKKILNQPSVLVNQRGYANPNADWSMVPAYNNR